MRYLAAIIVVLPFGAMAWAQQAEHQGSPGGIVTEASATAEADPDYFDFWFAFTFEGETIREGVESAANAGDTVLRSIETLELDAMEVKPKGPVVRKASEDKVTTEVRVRFGASPYTGDAKKMAEFGGLCDTLQDAAIDMEAELIGPVPGLRDKTPYTESAVSQALKKTLPIAEASAAMMNAQILYVSHADVTEVRWDVDERLRASVAPIGQLTCTANVRVIYAFGSRY